MSYVCTVYETYAIYMQGIEKRLVNERDADTTLALHKRMDYFKFKNRDHNRKYQIEKARKAIALEERKAEPDYDVILMNDILLGICKEHRHEPTPLELWPPAMTPPRIRGALTDYTPCVSAMETDD